MIAASNRETSNMTVIVAALTQVELPCSMRDSRRQTEGNLPWDFDFCFYPLLREPVMDPQPCAQPIPK